MAEFTPVLLTLPSLTPSLALEVLPRGLTIHRIFVQADGRTHDIVVGPEDPQDHVHKKYTNTVIGRYTNRVPVGTHILSRNGITSSFTAQANENEHVSLHGGPQGFDSVSWTPIPASASKLFTPTELGHLSPSTGPSSESSALFTLTSPHAEQGFPGTLHLEVLIALVAPTPESETLGSIVIVYRAQLEDADKVTPVNLTQHWGFNLDATIQAQEDQLLSVADHILVLKASHVVPITDAALPTGELTPTLSDPAHTLSGKKIGDTPPAGGYDHFYVFEPRESVGHYATRISLDSTPDVLGAVLATAADEEGVAALTAGRSGLKLVFHTNQSGVQFYSNNLATGSGKRKKIHGGAEGKPGYTPFSAAFLEFHEPLAAFLHPALQRRGDDTLLAPGEVYNNWVRVDVEYHRAG